MYLYFEDVNWGLLRLWGARGGVSVLDVGCGYATTSERLRRLGNRVAGIESSEEAIAVASSRLDEVIPADLQDLESVARLIGTRRFDSLIFADVLEHLSEPGDVLKGYLRFLAPGGTVLVSLPNVGLWSVRLSLLAGRFEYAETGVLDRTHLRFFTRRTARRLIEEAGLEITRRTYNPGIVRPLVPLVKKIMKADESGDPAAILESRAYRTYLKTIYPIERLAAAAWPGALAFQMIFEARPR
ncbi:MAG TPA: methyltransferase domain-containing protein [Thermoanaerobaculia bacterium]|nr:methyltransferase domain-containing protein [Thermoanaerobaculia bacterium]